MIKSNLKYNTSKGFTLIETMVAVFILTVALAGLLSLTANSLFEARYAKNEITANYLIQEAADHIRNDRDSIAFQQNNVGSTITGWDTFLAKYNTCMAASNTTNANGCYFEPAAEPTGIFPTPLACNSLSFGSNALPCPVLNYDENATHNDFYTYSPDVNVKSIFKRQVIMVMNQNNPDEIDVKITVEWLNGNLARQRSLWISLLNWQQ